MARWYQDNAPPHLCKELLIFIALFALPSWLAAGSQADPGMFNRWSTHGAVLLSSVPRTAFLLFYLSRADPWNRRRFGLALPSGRDLRTGLGGAALLLAFALAAAQLASLLPLEQVDPRLTETFPWRMDRAVMLLPTLATSLIIGFWEELFYRAYLVTRLRQLGFSLGPAAVLAALLFAAGHGYEGPQAAAMVFAMGLILTWIYRRSRSWAAAGLAHGLYNFFTLSLVFLSRGGG